MDTVKSNMIMNHQETTSLCSPGKLRMPIMQNRIAMKHFLLLQQQ